MRNRYDDERNRFEDNRYSNRSDLENRGEYGARPARYSQHQAEYGSEPDEGRGNWDRRGDSSFRSAQDRDGYASGGYGGYSRETRGDRFGDTMAGRYEQRRSPWSWQQGEQGGVRGDGPGLHGYGQGNQYEPRPFGDQHSWPTGPRTSGYGNGDRGRRGQTWGEPIGSFGYGPPRGEDEAQYRRGSSDLGAWRSVDRQNGQHRGKGPKGYTRSDERIQEEVSDRLMFDADIDASDIEIEVRNGEVTLRGTVDRRETKRAVEDLAESVQGVREVQNQLRVNGNGRAETGQESRTGTPQGRAASPASTSAAGGRARSDHETDHRSTTGTAR